MPAKSDFFDVVVIGGGPGGSMAGTLLTDFGKRVLILEASEFPRYHIGESLLSGTADLLQRIGVLDRIEKDGYIKKHGVEWVWGESREPWTVYFKDALAMPYDYGYQVERSEFDKLLLDNAAAHGADVRERHRVTDFALLEDGTSTVTFQDAAAGTTGTVRARWIVDASGQGGTVTKRLHQQHWDPYLKNLAVWSYWTGAERPPGLDAGNTFLPAFEDGWWWFIPLRDDITSVGMVVDSKVLHEHRGGGMEKYYADGIARTPELAQRLAGAERSADIHVARDWSYIYDRFAGDGYIAVGDAACFIDPLFSTGVHLAMLSGFLAAVTVNTVLDESDVGRDAALEFYETAYRKEFARLRAQVYFLYGGHGSSKDSYFWHARSQFDVPDIDPEKAFISLIAGAFAHRSWYSRYLEQLHVPTKLRSTIEDIFDGRSTGIGVDPQKPVVRSTDVTFIEDLAIDGSHLKPARSIAGPGGAVLPFTEELEHLLSLADGTTSSVDLVERLTGGSTEQWEKAHSLVHEAISYGLLVPRGLNSRPISTHRQETDMALVELLEEDDVPPEIAALLGGVGQEYGFVPNILRAMAHCPDLLTAFVPFWAQVYRSPTIGPRLRALAALGTAKAQDCTYCVAHMSASARRAGLDEEEIVVIGNLVDSRAVFEVRESLILEVADALTRDPDGVTDALRERLNAEFTAAEIVNIVLAVGMYNLTSRFLKALSIDVESLFTGVTAPTA